MKDFFTDKKKYLWLLLFFGIAVVFCCAFFYRKNMDRQIIQDTLYTDIDKDGRDDKIVLLWKRGRFGKHRPFWVKEDEEELSQHIFIYDVLENGELRQKWFASDIGREVKRMKIIGPDKATLLLEDTKGNNTLWRWESFGLKIIPNEVKMISFGDNIIHQEILDLAHRKENGSFDFLYAPFYKEIKDADIATFGAETVLVDDKSAVGGYPLFGSPLQVGEALVNAGFDVAVCGTNHALDRGIYGINVTTSFYKEKGILPIGIQSSDDNTYKPYEVISRNGMKFALFSYTYGTNGMDASSKYPYAVHYLPVSESDKKRALEDFAAAKKDADFVIVFAHWGNEYEKEVSDEQREMAQFFADAGADVIIGSHSHVVQKNDTIRNNDGSETIVFYSLGNFRAFQGRREETRTGAEAVVRFEHCYDGVRIKGYELKDVDAFVGAR